MEALASSSPRGFQHLMLEPWVHDGLTQIEVELLEELHNIAAKTDIDTDDLIVLVLLMPFLETVEESDLDAMAVFDLPWIEDGLVTLKSYLKPLQAIAVESPELFQVLLALPGVRAGPASNDYSSLVIEDFLSIITGDDPDEASALAIAGMPFLHSLEPEDIEVMSQLAHMHLSSPGSLSDFLSYPPMSYGITDALAEAFELLNDTDPRLETKMWSMPWVIDGITREEVKVIDRVADVARANPQLALTMAAQDWVVDGMDAAETAFWATALHMAGSTRTYEDLPKVRSKQHRTISLPLAGDVNVWVMDTTVAPPGEDLLSTIEDTARIAEAFMQEPFPVTDIVLIVVPEGELHGHHAGSYMVLSRRNDEDLWGVSHETGHYYFGANFRQLWLSEGGAQFIAAYVNDRKGVQTMFDRRLELLGACTEFENIVDWQQRREYKGPSFPGVCDYDLGEKLLLNILETIGDDAMSAGLSEVYVSDAEFREQVLAGNLLVRPSDERLYLAFLKHTPEDRKEALRELYLELHGGDFLSE